MKIEIKSVPPLVAPALRQRKTENAFIPPPNTEERRMSFVSIYDGKKSVKTEERKIISKEYRVNFLPMKIKLITTGTELKSKLIKVNGTFIDKYFSKIF